ncbi:hypothetical protein HDU98_011019 [Podochytrium sp. JEL0797]|nr:hypothetical protein HDU98_011019 [Podochytrium sp. JEL0797]
MQGANHAKCEAWTKKVFITIAADLDGGESDANSETNAPAEKRICGLFDPAWDAYVSNFPFLLPRTFNREGFGSLEVLTGFKYQENRRAARIVQDKWLLYIEERVPEEFRPFYNIFILYWRGNDIFTKVLHFMVDSYATTLQSDHMRKGMFKADANFIAQTLSKRGLKTWQAHYRNQVNYLTLLPKYLAAERANGQDVDYLDSYYRLPTTWVGKIFMDEELNRESLHKRFDNDKGKKNANLVAAHTAFSVFARVLKQFHTVFTEDYGCGGHNSRQCASHRDTVTEANVRATADDVITRSGNPHLNVQAQLNELLNPVKQLEIRRLNWVRDRTKGGQNGWETILLLNWDDRTGARSQESRTCTLDELILLKLDCDPQHFWDDEFTSRGPGRVVEEKVGKYLRGAQILIGGTKTQGILAKKGQMDSHYLTAGETQHPLLDFTFIFIAIKMMSVHGFTGDVPPFMGGVDKLKGWHVFEGASEEDGVSYVALYKQIERVMAQAGIKIKGKALHLFRALWGEMLRKMGVSEGAIEGLWNFATGKRTMKDIAYVKTMQPEVTKAAALHDPNARNIRIGRRVPIPLVLTEKALNGKVGELRKALENTEECKKLCQHFDERSQEMVQETPESMMAILEYWEFAVETWFYGIAYLRIYEPDLVPDGGSVMKLLTGFDMDAFAGLVEAVRVSEEETRTARRESHARMGVLGGGLDLDFADKLPQILEKLGLRGLGDKIEMMQEQMAHMTRIMELWTKGGGSAGSATASPGLSGASDQMADSDSATIVGRSLADSDSASIAGPSTSDSASIGGPSYSDFADGGPSTSLLTGADEALAPAQPALPPPLAEPVEGDIIDEDFGFTVKYARAYDPSEPFYENVPIVAFRSLGQFDSTLQVHKVALKYFSIMNGRHLKLWRDTSDTVQQSYFRCGKVVGHVEVELAQLRKEKATATLEEACEKLDSRHRPRRSVGASDRRVLVSEISQLKMPTGFRAPDFGLNKAMDRRKGEMKDYKRRLEKGKAVAV